MGCILLFQKMRLLLLLISSIIAADVCKNAAVSTCKFVIDEICGSNEKTYLNECVFQKAACFAEEDLTVAYKGACCPKECPTEINEENSWKSTCGVLYASDCEFYRQKCLVKRTVDILTVTGNVPEGDLELTGFDEVRRFFGNGESDCEVPDSWEDLLEDFDEVFLES